MMTTVTPETISTRLRISARRAAAAERDLLLAVPSRLVLLALPSRAVTSLSLSLARRLLPAGGRPLHRGGPYPHRGSPPDSAQARLPVPHHIG